MLAAVGVVVGAAPGTRIGSAEGPEERSTEQGITTELIGDDAFISYPAGEELAVVDQPAGTGYEVLAGIAGYGLGSYTVQLISSPGVEQLRPYVETAASQIAAATGLSVSVAAGSVPDRSASPGEILVRVAATSPCGVLSVPGIAGCGGPRTFGGLIMTGEVSVATQIPCDDLGISVVAHELGHAFGLAHYVDRVDGLLQLMFPSTSSAAPGFRAGDRAGLAAIAGRSAVRTDELSSSVDAIEGRQAVAGREAIEPVVELAAPLVPSEQFDQLALSSGLFSQPGVQRVLNTREAGASLVPGQIRELSLSPWVGSAQVDAVALNVTATRAAGTGYVTVFPTGSPVPATSNLNFAAGADAANLVIVKVGPNNSVSFVAGDATVDLLADLFGVFSPAGQYAFVAGDAARIYDTRESAVPGERGFPLGCGDWENTDDSRLRAAGVPTSAVAAVVNLTAVAPNAGGFVSLRALGDIPSRGVDPTTSNLNLVARDTRANLAITPGVPWINQISNSMAGDVVADVSGWFVPPATNASAARLAPTDPTRLIDTRIGLGSRGPFAVDETRTISIPSPIGAASGEVIAVVVNITVAGPTGSGYLTVSPTGISRPVVSNVNFDASDAAVPNLAVVRLGAGGAIDVYASGGSPHLIVDVMGYFVRS